MTVGLIHARSALRLTVNREVENQHLVSLMIQMLKNLRGQYKNHLKEQSLLEPRNSETGLETVRAVICGGLYPGIAMGRSKQPRSQEKDRNRGYTR